MSRVYFGTELEGIATLWRIDRRDGVALGFTSHDRPLWIDGLEYRAAPGMVPTAIARRADLSPDSADIEAALSHDAITARDLAQGRYDGAWIQIGIVDWEAGAHDVLYQGSIGATQDKGTQFSAELRSIKHDLQIDPVPRTGPACRAEFCGPGCGLSAARFTHEGIVTQVDPATSAITVSLPGDIDRFRSGQVRWIDGPIAGLRSTIVTLSGGAFVLENLPEPQPQPGDRVLLKEGCDHTLATCHARFANAVNFRAEPFLPGNDQLVRRPVGES